MTDAHGSAYRDHLEAAYRWIERSRHPRYGGSRASFSVLRGWSRTYPETTGYIIPTVLETGRVLGDERAIERALGYGVFLLGIQRDDGAWNGHLHPPRRPEPSVFNTAQIIKGMVALARRTAEPRWLRAAARAAAWLCAHLDAAGMWRIGNYRSDVNPTYYTQVAWPILEAAAALDDPAMRACAVRALHVYAARRQPGGLFAGAGFAGRDPAFTHTIAYTLRGFLESARLLGDWDTFGAPAVEALERFRGIAIERDGRIAGAYAADWTARESFVCLTGNAQLAICMTILHARDGDGRWLAAARSLVEEVFRHHALRHPIGGIRGGVPGSAPIGGAYMRWRYPNWAAKYLCDAIVRIMRAGEATGRG